MAAFASPNPLVTAMRSTCLYLVTCLEHRNVKKAAEAPTSWSVPRAGPYTPYCLLCWLCCPGCGYHAERHAFIAAACPRLLWVSTSDTLQGVHTCAL
jgi:hypothetical protein